MLAMYDKMKPKFVKAYANIGEQMIEAFKAYDSEVKSGAFPTDEHSF